MSKIRQLMGETVIYGSSHILNRVLNFIIVLPYLTRVFEGEQEQFGIHGIMYAYAALLQVIFTYGMETAYFRFAREREDRKATFGTAARSLLVSTVVLSALLLWLAEPIAGRLTYTSDWPYVCYFVGIIAFDVGCVLPFAALRLAGQPIRFALVRAFNVLVNGVVLVGLLEGLPRFAPDVYDPAHRLHYVFIANLVASLLTFLLLLPIYWREWAPFDRTLWRKLLRYGSPLLLVGIAGMINQLADRFLLKEWLTGTIEQNLEQVGIFNACVKIAVLMSLFTQAFKYAAEPFFFRQSVEADAPTTYARVTQYFLLAACLGFLGITLYLDVWQYLLDESYRSGLGIVPIALAAYLLLGLYYNLSVWFKVTDRTMVGAWIAGLGVLITFSVNWWLIPRIGIYGPVWAAVACFGSMCLLCLAWGQKKYPIPYNWSRMALYAGLALCLFGLSRWLALPALSWQQLVVHTAMVLGFVGVIGWLEWGAIGGQSRAEGASKT